MHNRCVVTLAVLSTLLVALQPAQAQTETVLYNFCSQLNCADGLYPESSLTADGAGNFYGTTQAGGTNNGGAVFELSPNGIAGYDESVLYSFCSQPNCVDGGGPYSNVIFDGVGNLYGTTNSGGAQCPGTSPVGCGTVFELSPEPSGGCLKGSNTGKGWCETILHTFTGKDGSQPFAFGTPVLDSAGNLYGTTESGGSKGDGTVWKLTPVTTEKKKVTWTEKTLHAFTGGKDGSGPWAGLVLDPSGNIYGATKGGGKYSYGTVFELAVYGTTYKEKILWAFNGADGSGPFAGLILDGGSLYGTASSGGDGGVAFEITP